MTLYQNKYRVESARLRDWDYRARGWYFVTMCAHKHACIFGEIADGEVQLSRGGQIAKSELQSVHTHYNNVQIDSFVVMPNHVQAIVAIDGEHFPRILKYLFRPSFKREALLPLSMFRYRRSFVRTRQVSSPMA